MALVDDELIREMHGDIKVLVREVGYVKAHQERTNGAVAEMKADALRQDGALNIVKWLIGVTLAMVSAGAALAGVILTIVMMNGA